jgi:aminopeptidase N
MRRHVLIVSRIIDEAQRQFKSYFAGDKKAINQNMRSAVFRICIAEGDVHEYHAVQQEYFNTTSVDGKDICLMAMCTIQTHDIASEYLDFLFSPQVAPQDMHTGGSGLAANSKTRRTLWSYIKSNWKAVHGKLSGNPVVLDRFLRLSLSNFSTFEIEKDIASFFKDKDNRGYDRSLGVISDTVRGNAAYLERDEKTLRKWLTVYGYMR